MSISYRGQKEKPLNLIVSSVNIDIPLLKKKHLNILKERRRRVAFASAE